MNRRWSQDQVKSQLFTTDTQWKVNVIASLISKSVFDYVDMIAHRFSDSKKRVMVAENGPMNTYVAKIRLFQPK